MVIEWLKVKVAAEHREKYIVNDAQVWTALLSQYPGFISKEVWINPTEPSEVILVIRWESREAWASVPSDRLKQIEEQFNREFGEEHQIIQSAEYQVRKFPQMPL